ncbi:carbohydrate binding domain-containing protein [Paenibacillus tarimensis]
MLKKRNGKRSKWLSVFLVSLTLFALLPISLPAEVHAADTTLVTYPNPPGGAALNTDFTVKVRANGGDWKDLDEYSTTVGGYRPAQASFVYFDTDGPVDVSVTYNTGTVSTAKVRPTSKGITPAINGNTLTFTIPGPTKLSVEVNDDIKRNLHLFANPLEVNPPSPDDPDVIYLGPGVYEGYQTVPSGKTLYIAGGAVVKGGVFLDGAKNAAVIGRGILDRPSWRGISVNYAENITIDGIIVNDYGMGGGGGDLVDLQNANNVTINNIKGFSYKSWTDGIDNLGSTNITINDCFIRSGDDSLAVYTARKESNFWNNATNQTVTNTILMPDVARPINFGTHGDPHDYEGGLIIENMSFSNIDILLNDTAPSPMFPIQFTNGDGNLIQNIQFTDIRIEDNYVHSIFNINNVWTAGQTGPGRGIKNIYFKNIYYTGDNFKNSNLTGYSPNRMVEDITFENLVVNGNLILDPAAGRVSINSNTRNIRFLAPGEGSYTPIPTPTPTYTNLALNATASSDSEMPGRPAFGGNDGNHLTNWSANDANTGHWWKVDLGSNKEIHGTKVIWDSNNVNYLYKVEVSTDDINWTKVADRTGSNSTIKTHNDPFNATARYVRITVTGLSPGAIASFNEFRVLQYNGSSLVKNGDFENGNTVTWKGNGMSAHISAAVNSTFGLDLRSPGHYAEQTITGLSPNTSYVLTVDAKGVSGTGRGYVYVKDYGDAQINKSIISDNTFHSASVFFVTGPSSTSATIGVYDTANRIQFDNFVLRPLVENGDFENGTISGWTGSGAAAQVWAAYNSAYGVELKDPGNYAEQTITGLSPNTSYTLTVDAKGVSGTGQGYVYVKDYGGIQIKKGIISDNNWHSTSITFTTGPNSTSATIGVYCTATRVSFDNFAVKPTPPLVQNGDFENGTLSGWTGIGAAAQVWAAYNSAYGVELLNPGNYAEQTITGLSPNTSYTLTVDAKGVSGTGQGYVYVKDYGGAQINKNIISDNNFHSMTITFTTGPDSTSATIGGYCTVKRIAFDNFVLNQDPDLVLLTLLLERAADIEIDYYTTESAEAFQTAVTNAQSMAADADASQDGIDAAAASLQAALNGLVYIEGLPVIAPVRDQTVVAENSLTFQVQTSNEQLTDVVYSVVELPEGATFDNESQVFAWTPGIEQGGVYEVAFTATSGELSFSRAVRITVIGLPVIDAEPMVELTAKEPFTYQVAASDPAGAVLSYSAENLPAGATLEEATGVLTWTPEQENYGSNLITFKVSNGSFEASHIVDFSVKLNVLQPEGYTQGSYYLYLKEVERIEAEMNKPDADKTQLAAQLDQAEAALVSVSTLSVERIEVAQSMVVASSISWDNKYDAATNGWRAVDGNTTTFTDTKSNPGWVLIDLGEGNEQAVGSAKFFPRINFQSRMNGAIIQGSNDGTTFTDLYTISGVTQNDWYTAAITDETAYRYLRFYSNGNGNVAELEFYGKTIDRTLLPVLLEEAAAVNAEYYTEQSIAVLQAAVSEAELVGGNADATQEEIDAASGSLLSGLEGLQWKDVTATLEPAEPNGNNGWYTSPVTVTLSPAPIAEYSLDGGTNWVAYEGPFSVTEEGTHRVMYRSVKIGETESLEIQIDLTAPVVQITGEASYTIDQSVTVTCSANDVVSNVYGTPCDQPLFQVNAYTLASGVNTATVTVEDMAGHQTTVTHTFTVMVTFDSMKAVTNVFLQETGAKASDTVATSLNQKLDQAKAAAGKGKIDAAKSMMDDYIQQVTDQTGKFFTQEQADILIRWARIVI